MSLHAEIDAAGEAILRRGRVVEIPALDPQAPLALYDAEDHDLLCQGDLACVQQVRGDRSILIQGGLRGRPGEPVRVEVRGDIIISGSVQHAILRGRRVFVGGSVTRGQLTAAERVLVGASAEAATFVAGDYSDDRRRVESTRLSLEQSRIQLESLQRRVLTEEKRLDKTCRALRIPLDFNVGRIVHHGHGRVRVDLSSFYESLEGRTDEQLQLALAEFFAKGVVGVIARANRKYLVNFPAREKVFMQLVRNLRDLFDAVLQRDRTLRQTDWMSARLEEQVEALNERRAGVEVGGAIAGDASMEFIVPRVVPLPDGGGFDFAHQTARLELQFADAAVEVVSCSTDGERARSTTTLTEFEGQRFIVDDSGVVEWSPADEAVGA